MKLPSDKWALFTVPAREDDRACDLQHSHVRADELTPEELADLSAADRALVDEQLAAMDAEAAIGADDERAWRDHEHGRDTTIPVVCG